MSRRQQARAVSARCPYCARRLEHLGVLRVHLEAPTDHPAGCPSPQRSSPVTIPATADELAENETTFRLRIVEAAAFAGWRANHVRPMRNERGTWATGCAEGWPDLTFLHPAGAIIAWEVKAENGGGPKPAQREWLDLFAAARVMDARTVWPSNWPTIARTLARPLHPTALHV